MITSATYVDLAELPLVSAAKLAAAQRLPFGKLTRIVLPFITLEIITYTPGYPELCTQALRQTTLRDICSKTLRIVVADKETTPELGIRLIADHEVGINDLIKVFEHNDLDGYLDIDQYNWHLHDSAQGLGLMVLSAPQAWAPWEASLPLRQFLHWGYAAQGKRLLHAATLGVGEAGALLVGSGGAGKSGTTLAGIMHGLTSVGDDYVVLAESSGKITAYPIARFFKQDRAGLKRVGIPAEEMAINWQGKTTLDPETIAPGCFVNSMQIGAIGIPRIANASSTTITRATAQDAMMAITPSNLGQLPGRMQSGFQFLSKLAKRLPAYHIALGTDPAETSATIRNWLTNGKT